MAGSQCNLSCEIAYFSVSVKPVKFDPNCTVVNKVRISLNVQVTLTIINKNRNCSDCSSKPTRDGLQYCTTLQYLHDIDQHYASVRCEVLVRNLSSFCFTTETKQR